MYSKSTAAQVVGVQQPPCREFRRGSGNASHPTQTHILRGCYKTGLVLESLCLSDACQYIPRGVAPHVACTGRERGGAYDSRRQTAPPRYLLHFLANLDFDVLCRNIAMPLSMLVLTVFSLVRGLARPVWALTTAQLLHAVSVSYFVNAAVNGMFFHGLLLSTRNIFVPIVAHAVHNAFALVHCHVKVRFPPPGCRSTCVYYSVASSF